MFERNKQTLINNVYTKLYILNNVFQKGFDGQKAKKKNGVLKGKTKGKPDKKTE